MSGSPDSALTVAIADPSQAAIRRDKARRIVDSPWAGAGVGVVTACALAAPIPWLVPAAIAGTYVGSAAILRRRVSRFLARMRPAYLEAENGSFSTALAICQAGMAEPWPVSHLSALTHAYFLRRSGEFDAAIEVNGLAAKTDDGFLRTAIGVELAVCFALKGKAGPAMTWLPPLRRKRAVTAASYAIVWARIGKVAQIEKLRLREGRRLAPFIRHELRVLSVMKAFAVSKEKSDYLSVRPLLLDAGPAYRSEFDYLGRSWPEMKDFIDTYVAPPK